MRSNNMRVNDVPLECSDAFAELDFGVRTAGSSRRKAVLCAGGHHPPREYQTPQMCRVPITK